MMLRRQSRLARDVVCSPAWNRGRSHFGVSTHHSRSSSTPVSDGRWLSGRASGPVGFVGLGNMGSRMAISLVRAGHDVMLFDADQSKATKLARETGATAASSLQELAQKSSSIVTMLPNTPHVEAVFLGNLSGPRSGGLTDLSPSREETVGGTVPETVQETIRETLQETEEGTVQETVQGGGVTTGARGGEGILDWVRPGSLVIDSSTIDPLASRRINSAAKKKGVTMIDAPVSGGVPGAENATLTFIVGGTEEGMDRARPLLMSMGAQAMHCGEAGAGCIAKVCNNLGLAISMIGVSEAMSLGSKMGMDPKVLASVLNASTSRCWSSEAYNPCPGVMEGVPSSRGFQGGFAASLMQKDLHLALQAANESSQSLPMGALAHQLYSLLCNQGNASKDFSGIYELIATGPGSDRPSKSSKASKLPKQSSSKSSKSSTPKSPSPKSSK